MALNVNILVGHFSRKFRSKKSDVKALSCTLNELKDIDPLDYLAKYCILE